MESFSSISFSCCEYRLAHIPAETAYNAREKLGRGIEYNPYKKG